MKLPVQVAIKMEYTFIRYLFVSELVKYKMPNVFWKKKQSILSLIRMVCVIDLIKDFCFILCSLIVDNTNKTVLLIISTLVSSFNFHPNNGYKI